MICWFFVGVLLAIVSDIAKKRQFKHKQLPIRQTNASCFEYQSQGPIIDIEPVEVLEDEQGEEDPATLLARSDIDRYEATKIVYIDLLDALEEETRIIQSELNKPETSDKRRTTLARRKSTLLGKIATTTSKLYTLDRQIERAYQGV